MYSGSAKFLRSSSSVADDVAVRAAGAEGRRARDDLLDADDVELGLARLADDVQLGGEPAVAQLGGDLLGLP